MSYIKNDYLKKNTNRLAILFMFCYVVLPQYFGVDISVFDFTAQRIMVVVFLLFIFERKAEVLKFFQSCKRTNLNLFLFIYLFEICFKASNAAPLEIPTNIFSILFISFAQIMAFSSST